MDHDLFGNQIGTVAGNANACQSCHQSGGLAHARALTEGEQAEPGLPGRPAGHGTSHRWDSSASGRVIGIGETPGGSLRSSGTYNGRYAKSYLITITSEGDAGSARFDWTASVPDGGGASGLATGAGVPLEKGLSLTFLSARTNSPTFRTGDTWQILVQSDLTGPGDEALTTHTADGTVVCSTCHDQHFQIGEPFDADAPPYSGATTSAGRQFMRMDNDTDQLCAQCHGGRFVTKSQAGSHPVGVPIPGNAAYHPPGSLPLGKDDNQVWCSSCHDVHKSAGADGTLLRTPGKNELCTQCHAQGITASLSSHLNPQSASLWPGGQYGSQYPAETDTTQRGGCGTCHSVHGWPDPSNPTNDYPALLVERDENLCYTCHDGNPVAKNLRANFTRTYSHPVSLSGRHAATEDGNSTSYGAVNRHSECADCHDVHQLAVDATPVVAPYASAALQGVGRVAVSNLSVATIVYSYRGPTDPTPVKEYELCFKCHSGWTTQPSGQSNLAAKFNHLNPSFHPVEARGKDLGINPASFVNGWSPGMLVTCTDCHTSDDTSVIGPHGSANRWILKRPYTRSNSPALASNGLCFDCHSASVYNTSGSSLSRWTGRDRPGHTHGGYNCFACHESHGSSTKPFLIGNSISTYTRTATGGSCDPSCHGNESYSVAYPR